MTNELITAIHKADANGVAQYLNNGGNPNVEESGTNALLWACSTVQPDIVKLLIQHGANINSRDKDSGDSALMIASYIGRKSIVEALLAAGAETDMQNPIGQTALMMAAKGGHLDVARLLVEHGADPVMKDYDGLTALHWSCTQGDFPKMAQYLLSLGLELTDKTSSGKTPIDYARYCKFKEALKIFGAE